MSIRDETEDVSELSWVRGDVVEGLLLTLEAAEVEEGRSGRLGVDMERPEGARRRSDYNKIDITSAELAEHHTIGATQKVKTNLIGLPVSRGDGMIMTGRGDNIGFDQ